MNAIPTNTTQGLLFILFKEIPNQVMITNNKFPKSTNTILYVTCLPFVISSHILAWTPKNFESLPGCDTFAHRVGIPAYWYFKRPPLLLNRRSLLSTPNAALLWVCMVFYLHHITNSKKSSMYFSVYPFFKVCLRSLYV